MKVQVESWVLNATLKIMLVISWLSGVIFVEGTRLIRSMTLTVNALFLFTRYSRYFPLMVSSHFFLISVINRSDFNNMKLAVQINLPK